MESTPVKFRPVMANERGVAGRAETRLKSVRRCLFQDDDRDEHSSGEEDNYRNSLLEARRRSSENARQRWNFDFEKEEPLPGRYEWVRVDRNGREVPDSQAQPTKSAGVAGERLADHADIGLEDNKMTENEDAAAKPEAPSAENAGNT